MDKNRQLAAPAAAAIVMLLLAMIPLCAAAGSAADKRVDCAALEREIRRIHSRMRAGYSARQGVRLDARLLKLKKKRARYCRR